MTEADADEPVGGPSFPRVTRVLATLMVLVLLAGLVLAWDDMQRLDLPSDIRFIGAAAALAVAGGYLSMLFSRTTLTRTHLRQGWLWQTEVALADIVQLKWLRWRWLDALVAPRLVLRVKARGTVTFHIGDPVLRERIEVLVRLGPADLPPGA